MQKDTTHSGAGGDQGINLLLHCSKLEMVLLPNILHYHWSKQC